MPRVVGCRAAKLQRVYNLNRPLEPAILYKTLAPLKTLGAVGKAPIKVQLLVVVPTRQGSRCAKRLLEKRLGLPVRLRRQISIGTLPIAYT